MRIKNEILFSHSMSRSSLAICLASSVTIIWCLNVAPTSALSVVESISPPSAIDIAHNQPVAQARVGGLDPNDYIDEAGEMEVLANQQQIPTAQLMSAAGHLVPDNFFLPGGSVPSLYTAARLAQLQQQQQQQSHHNQQNVDLLHQVGSHIHARHMMPPKFNLMASPVGTGGQIDLQDGGQLIDYNGFNLVSQPDPRDTAAQVDLADYLAAPSAAASGLSLYDHHQSHSSQGSPASEHQVASELANLAANQHHHQNNQNQQQDIVAQASETLPEHYAASGPPGEYQISGVQGQDMSAYGYNMEKDHQVQANQRPYGLPTKSSNKEPHGMLKPLGNPKTISSPAIDFITNSLPKTSGLEKLAEKIPQTQTPTILSFSSSKDPVEKVKSVNQKKRNVMRQAEQLAKMMIKSVNDKFGTNIGDQTDIPFLLSNLGPLGIAQNILFDPTLLVTLLNSAEKTYFSDVLPGPAKMAIRPVLNIFRVPNKKRDKGNLLNIISYLASGGQTGTPSKHRQGTGIEKTNKYKHAA